MWVRRRSCSGGMPRATLTVLLAMFRPGSGVAVVAREAVDSGDGSLAIIWAFWCC